MITTIIKCLPNRKRGTASHTWQIDIQIGPRRISEFVTAISARVALAVAWEKLLDELGPDTRIADLEAA